MTDRKVRDALRKAIDGAEDIVLRGSPVSDEKDVNIRDYEVVVTGRVKFVKDSRVIQLEDSDGPVHTLTCEHYSAPVRRGDDIVAYVFRADLIRPEPSGGRLLNDPELLRKSMTRLQPRELRETEKAYRLDRLDGDVVGESYGVRPSGQAILIPKRES